MADGRTIVVFSLHLRRWVPHYTTPTPDTRRRQKDKNLEVNFKNSY